MKSVIELRKTYATDTLTLWFQKRGTQGSSHSRYIPTTIEGTWIPTYIFASLGVLLFYQQLINISDIIQYLRFWWQCWWRLYASGMICCVGWWKTADVSEERNALPSGSANPTRLLHPEDVYNGRPSEKSVIIHQATRCNTSEEFKLLLRYYIRQCLKLMWKTRIYTRRKEESGVHFFNVTVKKIPYRRRWKNDIDVVKSVHHHTIQINQPTRCNSFTSLLLDVYAWLDMFRAPLRPSSGAYNCISSLWFYRWRVAVATLLVVVWQITCQTTTNNNTGSTINL